MSDPAVPGPDGPFLGITRTVAPVRCTISAKRWWPR